MKSFVLAFVVLILGCMSTNVQGQGCVAIRGNSTCGNGTGLNLAQGGFNAQMGYRYFKSFRHFRGSEQETHRIDEGTEVINHSHFVDFSLEYGITDRWFASATLPFVFHDRSSMYEHGGNPPNGLGERHETTASGIADVRLGLGFWLFDPMTHDFNYAVGLGVKLPTGKYDYSDLFYNQGSNRDEDVVNVVDQSIQPGDGGTGITVDVRGNHPVSSKLSISTNLYYLINPQATNGVSTRNGNSEFSCPDQYAVRLGMSYAANNGLNAFLGGRMEGVPSEDLIGSSEGYRRPGYAISVEPGIGYSFKNVGLFLSVPVALVRNRTQSYEDKVRTQSTGVYRHGDAAFADYLINFGVSYRFGGHGGMMHDM